jgi:hypothetical protein
MNRETIEKLAIDSAAGELTEDAEVLFQTYLTGNSQAKQWTEDILRVYEETEATIRTKTALMGDQMAVPRVTSTFRVNWLSVGRWAAAILLFTTIGFTVGRWEKPGQMHKIAVREFAPITKPVETITDLKERYVGTFWGDKMLALLDDTTRRPHRASLRDIRSWDKYRQFIKEKNNESP